MASKQKVLRNRVVKFFENHKDEGKIVTVRHFIAEHVSKSTLYRILNRKTTERKPGSGRKAIIKAKRMVNSFRRPLTNKSGGKSKKSAAGAKKSRIFGGDRRGARRRTSLIPTNQQQQHQLQQQQPPLKKIYF